MAGSGDVLERFGPATQDWFRGAFARPTDAQRGAWEAISHGKHALVVAPTGSGKTLAFVRRDRAKSVLVLRDLESGRETPIWDGLDRDMQEAWAIHGVYPHFDWMPDGDSLVLWAQGGLRRVTTKGQVTEIPFRVTDQREIREALPT